jgi:hypothetical protein
LIDRSWINDVEEIATILKTASLHIPVIHAQKEIGPALGNLCVKEQEQALSWLDANCHLGSLLEAHLVVFAFMGLAYSRRSF